MERKEISVEKLEPNNFNPNVMTKEEYSLLLQDMKACGSKHDLAIDRLLVSPKNVFYNDPEAEEGVHVIIDGEWRWKAAKELGWDSISCEIRCISEDLAKALNYRRSKERGHIDPLKEATLFKSEIDKGLSQKQVSLKYNASQPYVANRLRLIKLDERVVKLHEKPEETFKDIQMKNYEKQLAIYKEKVNEPGYEYLGEPEKPEEEDLIPRGIMTASHLEAISTLPSDKQAEIAERVVSRDLNVRETERIVKREKAEIARERRFKEALKKAKRPKCPECGGDPEDFAYSDESKFKCGARGCYNRWEYMKTRKEVEAEKTTRVTEENKQRGEQMKKARENPRYIRLPETPEQLHEKVKLWLLRKVLQLTEIESIRVKGKRGDKEINLDYDPPSRGYQHMDLNFKIDDRFVFGFNVQPKEYKKFAAKCRVDMRWDMKPSEKTRQALEKFLSETVKTNKDPDMSTN